MTQPQKISLPAKLLIVLLVLAVVELSVLIYLWHLTSFLFTLAIVMLTGFLGVVMAKREGIRVYKKAQEEMRLGRPPADSILDGIIILAGGIFLIMPGLVTDLIGISTLIPPVRAIYRSFLKRRFKGFAAMPSNMGAAGSGFRFYTNVGSHGAWPSTPEESDDEQRLPPGSPFEEHTPFDRLKRMKDEG